MQGEKGKWNALKSFLWTVWTAYRSNPYSPKCDLLWNTVWILLHFRRCSPCSPLHEHGRCSGVPTVAKNAALHSESVPRMRNGSISAQHSPCPRSLSLHSASPELQHLIWKVFNLSLSKESKYLTCWHWMSLTESYCNVIIKLYKQNSSRCLNAKLIYLTWKFTFWELGRVFIITCASEYKTFLWWFDAPTGQNADCMIWGSEHKWMWGVFLLLVFLTT